MKKLSQKEKTLKKEQYFRSLGLRPRFGESLKLVFCFYRFFNLFFMCVCVYAPIFLFFFTVFFCSIFFVVFNVYLNCCSKCFVCSKFVVFVGPNFFVL